MNAPLVATDTWVEVLDQLEQDLAELDGALEDGEVIPVQAWLPPGDLGPLPDELQPRAEGLAVQLARLQSRTRDRLGELSRELADVEQRRKAGTAYTR
ncbi:MAG: hypothetical protein KG028_04450 [Actinobacteria bacterium]|jgi:chaperonin cofactor prefoldin|nr:hypothetical protein [Actinomycetota bacterium]